MNILKKGVTGTFCCLLASTVFAIDVDWNIQTQLTNTLVPLGPTVSIEAGEKGLLEVKFVAKNGVASEELETKTYPNTWPKGPFRTTTTFNIDVDSTHWAHGTNVIFEIHVKYFDAFGQVKDLIEPITTTRPVYNKFLTAHDTTIDDFGFTVFTRIYFKSFNYASSGNLASTSWTRDNFLDLTEDPTAILTFSHGGIYGSGDPYLVPPGGGGDISPLKVSDSLLVTTAPNLQFAFLLGCKSANNSALLNAFLSESGTMTNRCAIGFKEDVDNTYARDMVYTLLLIRMMDSLRTRHSRKVTTMYMEIQTIRYT